MKSIIYKIIAVIVAIATVFFIGRCSVSQKNSQIEYSYKLDSINSYIKANMIDRDTYEEMNDRLGLEIKNLQDELDIRTKDLNSAARMISSLKDSLKIKANIIRVDSVRIDSVTVVGCDSISIIHENEFDTIHVSGNTCYPEEFNLIYSINSNLSVFDHIVYKDAKTKIGRWWNRLWKIKPRTVYTIKADNPNFKIKDVKVIKIDK